MVKPIEASGGLVVRPSPDRPQILIVHRPRYDDWTFPKGKNEPEEDPIDAALREVSEETGQQPRPIALVGETSYTVNGATKRIRWFGMRTNDPRPFTPNDEVDEIRWVDSGEARALLSYHHDRVLLDGVDLDALVTTGTMFLVRHGAAGDRSAWTEDDRSRPLSTKGGRHATGLMTTLADRRVEAIVTSPYLRCVQTVEPVAEAAGVAIVEHPALGEGEGGKATRELLIGLAGTNAVVCSHGDVIPAVVEWMVRRGMTLKSPFECKKGSVWEVEVNGGEFRKARYLPPVEA